LQGYLNSDHPQQPLLPAIKERMLIQTSPLIFKITSDFRENFALSKSERRNQGMGRQISSVPF